MPQGALAHDEVPITIRPLVPREDGLQDVAALVYQTDPHIFPAAFGDCRTAGKVLPLLMRRRTGLFGYRNIRVAVQAEEFVGVIVALDHPQSTSLPPMRTHPAFRDVNRRHFATLGQLDPSVLYIAYLCVRPDRRRRGIGRALLRNELGRRPNGMAHLDVLAENTGARSLYQSAGFTQDGPVVPGYSFNPPPPPVVHLTKSPQRADVHDDQEALDVLRLLVALGLGLDERAVGEMKPMLRIRSSLKEKGSGDRGDQGVRINERQDHQKSWASSSADKSRYWRRYRSTSATEMR